MVYQLVKHDPTAKFACYMMAGFALAGLLTPPSLGIDSLLLLLGCFSAGLLQSPAVMARGTLFYAALPISGRQLFLARVALSLAMGAAPFFAAAATHILTHPADSRISLVLLAMGAVFAFFILVSLSLRIEEFSPPVKLRTFLPWMAVLAAPALYWPATAMPILAAATLGCLVRWLTIWPRVPASFQAAPFEPADAPFPMPRDAAPASPSAWWAIARASFSWQAWMMIPVVLTQALYLNSFLALMMGFGIPSQIRLRTRWLAALPMSPRALLALILLPFLLPLAAGYVLAAHFGFARTVYPRFVADAVSGKPTVKVPLEYWQIAPGGVAPVIQAPWGETFQPPTDSILGIAVYNPYASGPNTDRFQYWQYSRAAEAVYGEPLTFDDVEAGRRAGRLQPIAFGGRAQIFGAALLVAIALATQWLFGLTHWRRLPLPPTRNHLVTGLTLAIVVPIGLDFWFAVKGPGSVILAMFNSLVLHAVRWLPDQFAVTLAVALLMAAIPYFVLERQFQESEVPDPTRTTGSLTQSA